MHRNLDRRVETICPVLDEGWRTFLKEQVLDLYLRDTARARVLQPDGSYVRRSRTARGPLVDAQATLLAATRAGKGDAQVDRPQPKGHGLPSAFFGA